MGLKYPIATMPSLYILLKTIDEFEFKLFAKMEGSLLGGKTELGARRMT